MGIKDEGTIERISQPLRLVRGLRDEAAQVPGLVDRVRSLKIYQQTRFRRSYADLLGSPRFGGPSRFFLEELYGPADFSRRDAQFLRVVPRLVRLFPERVVVTVMDLVDLHALSERLDLGMAKRLPDGPLHAQAYWQAWQAMGDGTARVRQLDLVLKLGASLDALTRSKLLRQTLHLMRKPAQAAGLAELQQFLERGFDTFADMKGADDFLNAVHQREAEFIAAMGSDFPTFEHAKGTLKELENLPD